MKRGLAPSVVHSALAMTRLRRDQLSRVDHMKSRKTRAARPLVPSGSPGGDCLAVLEAVTAGLARLGPMAAVAAHEAAAHLTGGLWLAPAVPPLNVNTTWDTAGVIAAS